MSDRPSEHDPVMAIAIHESPYGRFREVCFTDIEDADIYACSGYLNAAERAAFAARLREVADELEGP